MINVRTNEAMRQIKGVKQAVRQLDTELQTDSQTDRQTDGAGPTSSISWLQEGMAGKMQQNLRGRKKNVQSFQNHRGRSRDMSKQYRQTKRKNPP